MGLNSIGFGIEARSASALNGRDVVDRVDRWFSEIGAIASFWGTIDGEGVAAESAGTEAVGETRLWAGESLRAGSPLTELEAHDATSLRELLGRRDIHEIQGTMSCALAHHPTVPGLERGLYGRVALPDAEAPDAPPSLLLLCSLGLEWTRDYRTLDLELPLAGYPITHHEPTFEENGAIRTSQMQASVEANQRQLVEHLRRLPRLLGVDEPKWHVDWQDALLPQDREALRAIHRELEGKTLEGTA